MLMNIKKVAFGSSGIIADLAQALSYLDVLFYKFNILIAYTDISVAFKRI